VPSDKRQRQRAAREARREAELVAQRRRKTKSRAVRIVLLVLVGLLGAYLVYNSTKPEETNVATDDDDTTTSTTEFVADPSCPPDEGTAERTTAFSSPPPMCVDTAQDYKATVETDLGTFTIDLLEKKAPKTVNNFVFLARNRFYEEVPFHRVIPGFVVQGGDGEKGNGTGGPGYQFEDELPEAGEYEIGSVAMANSGPNTNGSQFFVVTGEQGANLPPSYSLFGTVTEGLDVVKQIEADGTDGGTPSKVHKIVKVTVTSS
jgi:cyclophilin family peptidyl-prolyl cis-trans isomerase/type II secretory pathway pseudopilin PulG